MADIVPALLIFPEVSISIPLEATEKLSPPSPRATTPLAVTVPDMVTPLLKVIKALPAVMVWSVPLTLNVQALEAFLHSIGYKYTGPGNLYQITFFEIASLTEGKRILALIADGVTPGEETELNRLAAELAG